MVQCQSTFQTAHQFVLENLGRFGQSFFTIRTEYDSIYQYRCLQLVLVALLYRPGGAIQLALANQGLSRSRSCDVAYQSGCASPIRFGSRHFAWFIGQWQSQLGHVRHWSDRGIPTGLWLSKSNQPEFVLCHQHVDQWTIRSSCWKNGCFLECQLLLDRASIPQCQSRQIGRPSSAAMGRRHCAACQRRLASCQMQHLGRSPQCRGSRSRSVVCSAWITIKLIRCKTRHFKYKQKCRRLAFYLEVCATMKQTLQHWMPLQNWMKTSSWLFHMKRMPTNRGVLMSILSLHCGIQTLRDPEKILGPICPGHPLNNKLFCSALHKYIWEFPSLPIAHAMFSIWDNFFWTCRIQMYRNEIHSCDASNTLSTSEKRAFLPCNKMSK